MASNVYEFHITYLMQNAVQIERTIRIYRAVNDSITYEHDCQIKCFNKNNNVNHW
jgi:hypothetical protein